VAIVTLEFIKRNLPSVAAKLRAEGVVDTPGSHQVLKRPANGGALPAEYAPLIAELNALASSKPSRERVNAVLNKHTSVALTPSERQRLIDQVLR